MAGTWAAPRPATPVEKRATSKSATRLPIAPYFGVAYGTYQNRLRYIGGLNIGFTEQLTSLVIFDGVHVHPTMNFSYKRHALSFILVRGKEPGVSYSISF